MPLGSKRSRLAAEREARRLAKTPAAPPPEFWLLSVQAKFARAIIAGTKLIELRRRRYNIAEGDRMWFYQKGEGIVATARCHSVSEEAVDRLKAEANARAPLNVAEYAAVTDEELSALGEGVNTLNAYWLKDAEATLRTIALDEMRAHGIQAPQGAVRIARGHSFYNVLREAVLPF